MSLKSIDSKAEVEEMDRPFARLRTVATCALIGVAAALVAAVPASGQAGFGDIAGSAYYAEAVQWMVDNEITQGTEPGCFSPEDTVTRGQAAAFMWRMEGRSTAPAHSFVDVLAPWQTEAVAWMAANEITTGTTATTFAPDDFLTRGQMAALLWRLAGRPAAPAHGFSDVTEAWMTGAVSWMAESGVTTGTTPTTFSPYDPVTRGQLAAFFHRYKGSPSTTVDPASPSCGGPVADEFDTGPIDLTAGTTATWQVRNASAADIIDIDRSTDGALVIVPTDTFHNGWYATNEGPFVYQNVSGNMAAAIRLTVVSATDPTGPPGNGYNSGGFVLRDGAQPNDWIMFNIGGQTPASGFAREVKTTVDGTSVLQLEPVAATTHRLLICRVGAEIRYFMGAADTTDWTIDPITHQRPDFGDELQIGIVANAWESGPRPRVEVERIAFGQPSSLAECTSSVAPV